MSTAWSWERCCAPATSCERSAQLVEAPGGTLLTSHTVQSSLGDLFRLQDDIARRVVEALSLPLVGGDASSTPHAPHNARAYELYLRANELARTYDGLPQARDLYQRCLELDPSFAPAWAHLGRCHRVIGKFIEGSSDSERPRRGGLPPRPRAQPATVGGAQVLRAARGGDRSRRARARAPARRGHPSRQRSGAVRRARPRLSLLRSLRSVDRRARGGAAARPERADEPGTDDPDDRRHRAAPRGRAADGARAPTRGFGSSALDWRDVATKRAGRCST